MRCFNLPTHRRRRRRHASNPAQRISCPKNFFGDMQTVCYVIAKRDRKPKQRLIHTICRQFHQFHEYLLNYIVDERGQTDTGR